LSRSFNPAFAAFAQLKKMARRASGDDGLVSVLPPGILPSDDSPLGTFLARYKADHGISTKGTIAVLIFASRLARVSGLPFDTTSGLHTEGAGQIRGLGKAAVQKILGDYGIAQVLAEEGGRTSRGGLGRVADYLNKLNELNRSSAIDMGDVEAWWVAQATRFFNAKPFILRFEAGQSLRAVIRDLLDQAGKRQEESGGTMFVGAMLQHLVGAKLVLALPGEKIEHNGFSVADAAGGRAGDFDIDNSAIHVTTHPGEAVIRKCQANLSAGKQPIIVTLREMVSYADVIATEKGIQDKIDVLDAEQFIVANLHEFGSFKGEQRKTSVDALVDEYNKIITAHETDLSLQISRG
jgi:Domain of unknown function (DUF4928)